MALPKRRHSKSRSNKRRNHQSLPVDAAVVTCAKCGAPVAPHNACRACGYYKGRKVDHTVKEKDKAKSGSR